MKISHTQLESCLANPRGWIQSQASPSFPPKFGYKRAVLYAIHQFHKVGSVQDARRYLELSIKRHFTDKTRSAQALDWLDSYIEWNQQASVIVFDSSFNIRLRLGVWLELSGQIHRLDLIDSGYRAILLGDYPPNWRNQLRLPLLQRAIAARYERPEDEIQIGVQRLDGSGIETVKFTSADISNSEMAFKALSSKLQQYAQNYPSLTAL